MYRCAHVLTPRRSCCFYSSSTEKWDREFYLTSWPSCLMSVPRSLLTVYKVFPCLFVFISYIPPPTVHRQCRFSPTIITKSLPFAPNNLGLCPEWEPINSRINHDRWLTPSRCYTCSMCICGLYVCSYVLQCFNVLSFFLLYLSQFALKRSFFNLNDAFSG